jgi:hypothetical protein
LAVLSFLCSGKEISKAKLVRSKYLGTDPALALIALELGRKAPGGVLRVNKRYLPLRPQSGPNQLFPA